MKPGDIKSNTYIDFNKGNDKKYTKLKLVIMKKCRNIKRFSQKITLQIDLRKFL